MRLSRWSREGREDTFIHVIATGSHVTICFENFNSHLSSIFAAAELNYSRILSLEFYAEKINCVPGVGDSSR